MTFSSFVITIVLILSFAIPIDAGAQATRNRECNFPGQSCPVAPPRQSAPGPVFSPSAGSGLSGGEAAAIGAGMAILGIVVDSMIADQQRREAELASQPSFPSPPPASVPPPLNSARRIEQGSGPDQARADVQSALQPRSYALHVDRIIRGRLRPLAMRAYARSGGQGLGALISRALGQDLYDDRTVRGLSDLAGQLILTTPSFSGLRDRFGSVKERLGAEVYALVEDLKRDVSLAVGD